MSQRDEDYWDDVDRQWFEGIGLTPEEVEQERLRRLPDLDFDPLPKSEEPELDLHPTELPELDLDPDPKWEDQAWFDLSSSNLKGCAYHDKSKYLWIEFHNGYLYRYCGVPREVFDALLSAPSAGKYHHANIRCTYQYEPQRGTPVRDEDCYARTRKC